MDPNLTQPSPYQSPQPIAPPPPNSPRFSKRNLIILAGVMILIPLLLAGTYLLGQKDTRTPIAQNSKTSPTPTADPTANWETYTSPNGYSFKYPSDMNIKLDSEIGNYIFEIQLEGNGNSISFRKPIQLGDGMTLEEALDQHVLSSYQEESIKKNNKNQVDGRPAFRVEGDYMMSPTQTEYRILQAISLENNQYLYIETFGATAAPSTQREILDQILSTFKFLDSSDETANWKTYNSTPLAGNSLQAYTINYPDSWVPIQQRQDDTLDRLTLTRDGHTISIYQAAFGGGGCIFEGHVPIGPFSDLRNTEYTQIDSGIGRLRRFIAQSEENDPNIQTFDFCVQTPDNNYGSPTHVGEINYNVPVSTNDPKIITEMDKIIKTLDELE